MNSTDHAATPERTPDEVAAQALDRHLDDTGRAAAFRPVATSDTKASALAALLDQLTTVGIDKPLREARKLLDRAAGLRQAPGEGIAAARRERDALPTRLATGEVDIEQAAVRLAELAPWLPDSAGATPVGTVAEQAAAEVEKRALRLTRDHADTVLDSLAARARTAVDAAAEAVDRITVSRGLTLDKLYENELRALRDGRQHPIYGASAGTAPPAELAAWAAAQEATTEFTALRELAAKLARITGRRTPLHVFAAPGSRDQQALLARVPEPLQLGLAARSGWEPGLHRQATPRAADERGIINRLSAALTGRR